VSKVFCRLRRQNFILIDTSFSYLFTSGVRGFAAKDFIWRAFIFYAHPRVKNERTPKYYFPGRALLNSYSFSKFREAKS